MTTSRWARLLTLVAGLGVAVCTVLLSAQGPASLGAPAASDPVAAGTPQMAQIARMSAPARPAASGGDAIPDLLVGPGSGAQPIRLISGADGSELGTGFPFGPAFTGGVHVAVGDVNGDGIADIVAAQASGGSFVRVFDGRDSTEIVSGYPFGPAVTSGVYVAAGDIDGDGHDDVIVGSGAGSGLVRGYRADATEIFSIAPFGGGFTGGVQVAVGDVDGDGVNDLVTGQAAGNLVSIFSGATQGLLSSGYPYGTAFTGGVALAVGDINGDGRAEIITAPTTGAGSVLVVDAVAQSVVAAASPYPGYAGGVRVATADFDGDGRAEVITAPGPGTAPIVNVYSGGTLAPYTSLAAYPATFAGGVFIAASSMSGPRFTSADTTTFSVGAPGTFTVSTAATPPVTSIVSTGALPAGVTFVDNGDGTATLAGTPTGPAGTSTLTFTASNGTTHVAQTFTLTVQEAPVITSPDMTTFSLGAPGSFTVTATGFPVPALSVTGALPAGVTFVDNGDGTGTLGGTPAAGTAGAHALTITASNGAGAESTQAFTLTVDESPAFTSADTTTFSVGAPGTFTVTTVATPPVTSIVSTGALPAGVTFVDNGDGTATLAGTPTGPAGTSTLTFTASNGTTPAVQTFTLTVQAGPTITSPDAVTFSAGVPEAFTVTATGLPVPVLSVTGTLPAGVTFVDNGNGTGTLGGTADAGAAGVHSLTITASNGTDSTQAFTLTVDAAPAFTSADAATFAAGVDNTFLVTTSGFPVVSSITETGPLPAGVTFTDHGDGTATLGGVPAAGSGGSYSLTLTGFIGPAPVITQAFTLTVDEAPAFTSTGAASFTVGTAGTFTVQTTGFPVADIASSGALPSGVTFTDNADGTATLAGTAAAGTTGSYPLALTATNTVGSPAIQAFTLSVVCPAMGLIPTDGALPDGVVGETYVQPMSVFGDSGDFTWAISAGALPGGLIQTSLGTLAGTPVAAGDYAFTVTATSDTTGCQVTGDFTLSILEVPAQASADSFTGAVGNTPLIVGGTAPATPAVVVAGNVLSNDSGTAPLSAVVVANATNGVVTMAPNGTFTYTPAAGFSGPSDSFTYQLTDGNGTTDTALVTIGVSNIVWYVNPAASPGGDGTSALPFQTLTAAQAEAGDGGVIYVHPGTLTTGITLGQGRTLWGAGAPLSIGSLAIPAGTTPVITGTVTVNGNNATVSSVSISTGTAPGFTTSGTVSGLQVINGVAVNTTSGTAVNLANVTSGALGVGFGSVSSNGATNAVVLSNVNTSGTGTVTIGSGTTDGAGGVIQNTSGDAIMMTNTRNVTLDHLIVRDSATSGLHLVNLWGDSAFHDVIVEGFSATGVSIENDSGTLSSLEIDGVTIRGSSTARGLTVLAQGSATIDDVLVQTSTFEDNGLHTSFEQANTANLTFRLVNNQLRGANPLQAVNIFSASTATGGTIQGRIQGNTIGDAAIPGSGSSGGSGIRAVIQGGTTATLLIDDNTIRETPNQRGMNLQFLGATGGGTTVTHNVTITNNDVDHVNLAYDPGVSEFPLAAIYLSADNQGTGGNVTVKANIAGNTVPTAASAGVAVSEVLPYYLIFDEVVANATCQLVGAAGDATTQLASTNTGDAGAAAGCAVIGGSVITPP